jgi:hypothetical protein
MANLLNDLRKLLVEIVEDCDKDCFKLLAGFVAAVEARYEPDELIELIQEGESNE